METFAERLNGIISERGIKKAELARRIGIARSTITEYCAGRCEPTREVIYKMAIVLGVSEAWLIGIPGAMKARVDTMNSEVAELIRIYKILDTRKRNQLLSLAYELEDNK